MDRFYIGHITSYFGLKGEVKVTCDYNAPLAFKKGNTIYIDDNPYEVNSFKVNNRIIISLVGYDDINAINHLIGKDIYASRESLNLSNDEFFPSEIENFEVISDGKMLGKVDEVLLNSKQIYIKVSGIIIPLIKPYLDRVDFKEKKVYVNNGEALKI